MSSILGLTSSKTIGDQSWRSETARRQVFYNYPNGTAPMTGLLSIMESESNDHPLFGWWEQRYVGIRAEINNDGTSPTGPFFDSDGTTEKTDPWTVTSGNAFAIFVATADVTQFKVDQQILIQDVELDDSTTADIHGYITAVNTSTGEIDIKITQTISADDVSNDASDIDTSLHASGKYTLTVVGNVAQEGQRSKSGRIVSPINPHNYMQIHRSAFSFTRTATKEGLKFDDTGVYKNKAKDNLIDHMTGIELSNFFGIKQQLAETDADDSEATVRNFSGGVLHWLKEWELGNTTNGAEYDYRPGGSDVTASNIHTEDLKRLITVNGTMSMTQLDNLIERCFRVTNNKAFEKLALCGSGFLKVLNQGIDNASTMERRIQEGDNTFGLQVVSVETVFGTIHFKQHPLLTENPRYRNSCLIVDVHNLIYHHLTDSDTDIYKGRAENDRDRRKDEWITECGLEVRFPESHMWIDNLTGLTS